MSSWRVSGSLDDPVEVDGDGGFVGMNQRDPVDRLGDGVLRESRNGRIDGSWEARKGIELKSGALSSGSNPLRLPFFLVSSSIVVSSASRASDVVTIDLASGHGLVVGDVGYLTIGTPGNATDPLTGTDDVDAGSYLMTVVDADTLSFAHEGVDEALVVDGTHGKVWTYLYDSAVSRIWGACVFSNPASALAESAVLAATVDAKLVGLGGYAVTSLSYPFGSTVESEVEMIQAFDRVYLFREGLQAWEWLPQGRSVVTASYVSVTGVVSMQVVDHGLTVGDTIVVSGVGFSGAAPVADPNGTHVVATVVDKDNFTYVDATGNGDETYTAGTGLVVVNGFTKVAGGVYTQPQTFDIAGNQYGVSSGLVRLTVVGNDTIRVGDFVTVHETDIAALSSLVGRSYEVVTATSTDIYFYASVANVTYASGSGAESVQFSGRFSVGGGFSHMPGPAWGVYFQRRLWCPFAYSVGGTGTVPTYTARNKRDEFVASDILDGNTYDQIYSQFRVTAGIADYLVGMYPFYNDYILVMNRNSVHVVKGTQGDLDDTVVHELTREVGCVARKSIAGQGNRVFFLSDGGVYGLEFQDEYNLRGLQEPLSKDIQPLMDRINKSLADDSVGVFFNNRYYLAVPLDSWAGAGDAQGNNTVLVYNMLNSAWESIDTYGGGEFLVMTFLVGQANKVNQLFLVNNVGGLHLSDARENATDVYSLDALGESTTEYVDYSMQTRGYGMRTMDRKRFHRAQVQIESNKDNVTNVDFLFSSEDPDSDGVDVGNLRDMLGGSSLEANEKATARFRLGGVRGVFGNLTVRRRLSGGFPVGRPKVTGVRVDATVTNRATISQK